MKPCIVLKRLAETTTKPSRWVVSIGGFNKKSYPTSLCNERRLEDELIFFAEKYLADKKMDWLIEGVTQYKELFIVLCDQ